MGRTSAEWRLRTAPRLAEFCSAALAASVLGLAPVVAPVAAALAPQTSLAAFCRAPNAGGAAGPAFAGELAAGQAQALSQSPTYVTYGDERLAALIEEGLTNNPRVRAAWSAWQTSRHRVAQATARPDPMFTLTQHLQPPETRVGPQIAMLAVRQRLPGFGKLDLRGRVAASAAVEQGEQHRAQRADLVRSVKGAWYDLAFIDRALAINREGQELLERYEAVARARYAQGLGLQADVVRMQAEYTRALSQQDDLERQRVDAEATLNALLARPVGDVHGAVEQVALPSPPANVDSLVAAGHRARPEVRAALRRVETREHAAALAQRARWPDFDVGVVWGALLGRNDPAGRALPPPDNGRDVFSLTAGVNLPVFGERYKAGVREASESLAQACALYEGAVDEMERAVRSTLSRILSLKRQLALFEDALLPQTEQALHSTEAAYSTGTVGALDLLDGERRLQDVRLGLARLATDYMKALADIERVVGAIATEGDES